MLYKKEKKIESLTRAGCIGILVLASVVVLIGCPDAGGTTPPADTIPPAPAIIDNVTAAPGSVDFEIANLNAEAVQVTIALAPPPPTGALVTVDGESKTIADTSINLTNRGTERERKKIRITGLTSGETYTITLTTADSSGNSQQLTGKATVPFAPPAPPGAPAGFTAVLQNRKITLSWSAPAGGAEVTGYRIYRAVENGDFVRLTTYPEVLPKETRAYTDAPVSNDVNYRYRVRAVNANGAESADSNPAPAPFHLHANGVTILCPFANINERGMVGGVIYTKRTSWQIRNIARSPDLDTRKDAARSCTSGIKYMNSLFRTNTRFNSDINHWDTRSVKDMSSMFLAATAFNQNIGSWNVSAVTDMSDMFQNATNFNQNIGSWDVGAVTNMHGMFTGASNFNQNIGRWNVEKVTDMSQMFMDARAFNQIIGSWDVGAVTDMSRMFWFAEKFNQNIGEWDVAAVKNMDSMFVLASAFNKNIGGWNVGAVTNMRYMFNLAEQFDQDIGGWNVKNVTNMDAMFRNAASFNQNISAWCIPGISGQPGDFSYQASKFVNTNHPNNWGTAVTSCPPNAPTGLTAIAGDGLVTLSWTAPSGGNSFTEYRVYRSSEGSAAARIATVNTSTTSYTNTGLTNGTTYTYTVRAVNTNGESGANNSVTATPRN